MSLTEVACLVGLLVSVPTLVVLTVFWVLDSSRSQTLYMLAIMVAGAFLHIPRFILVPGLLLIAAASFWYLWSH